MAGQPDEILRGLAIRWRKLAQPAADVAEFFNLLGQVADRSLRRPDTIRIRLERACALGQRQVDAPHLLATKFVEQIPAFVAEGLVRYRLEKFLPRCVVAEDRALGNAGLFRHRPCRGGIDALSFQ